MAARRGKSQARRNHGNSGGVPGWAWGVIGLLLGAALIVAAPRLLKSDGDGFFRPRPNPDAEPAPVAINEDEGVASDIEGSAPRDSAKPGVTRDKDAGDGPEYDFYTLLPGKEVPLSDAELAATERAEAQRAAQQRSAGQAQAAAAQAAGKPSIAAGPAAAVAANPLPPSVDAGSEPVASPPAATPPASAAVTAAPAPAAAAKDNTRYLLQAGAFQASGQAEDLKARIALLGLGARVESASIRGKTVYRVRMGPYGTAGDLAEAKRKLASGGLPGMAIKVE